MRSECQTIGEIIKTKKLWWIKINTKVLRKSALDGATFPYLIRVKYSINNVYYEKNKLVYWKNESINIGDKVVITYAQDKPLKILKLSKIDKQTL